MTRAALVLLAAAASGGCASDLGSADPVPGHEARAVLRPGGAAVEAEWPDAYRRGAVFAVRLPAAAWPPPAGTAAAPSPEADGSQLAGLSILVVEDEADTRQLLEQLLTRHGARVACAANAEAALARLGQDLPDILLCDIAMPGEDGCALIRKVRSCGGELGSVPAIALTALAGAQDRARALQAGFQAYLTKPIEPPQILDALRALVGRS